MAERITLLERLRKPTPLGYNGVWWDFRGESNRDISSLIDLVLDRYALRFGFVEPDQARGLQDRLLARYNIRHPGVYHTRKAL